MKCARHTGRAKKDELLNLLGLGVEQAADHVVREAAALQETSLARLFLRRGAVFRFALRLQAFQFFHCFKQLQVLSLFQNQFL